MPLFLTYFASIALKLTTMQAEIASSSSQTAPRTTVAWPHIVLAVIGLALSIYAVRAHNLIEAGQGSGCTISESISCDTVIGSQWGEFAGIPLGYFGGIFWILVAITAISGAGVSFKSAALQRLGVATVGLLFSVGLFYIAEFVIPGDKHCPICLGTHFTSLVNFIFAVSGWRKLSGKKPLQTREEVGVSAPSPSGRGLG